MIKSEDTKQILKKKFIKWCKDTTNHGVPKIVSRKNKFIRLMWLLFFIASVTCCIYVITMSLIDFYKYKTAISIHHYQDTQTILPAITICNMNPFNINHVGQYFKQNPLNFGS
jgi:hypothetical protein